jgi:hypothetical protein
MRSVRCNWLALLVIIVVHFVLGAAWYSLLAEPWMAALGKTADDFANSSPAIYLLPIAASVLNTLLLALVMGNSSEYTVSGGVKWALLLWVGLVFPYSLVHDIFSGFPFTLTLINSGNQLVALLLAGVVLGAMRPKTQFAADVEMIGTTTRMVSNAATSAAAH